MDSRVRAVRESYAGDERERTREVSYSQSSGYTSASRHEEREACRKEELTRRAAEVRCRQAETYDTSDYDAPVRRRASVSHGHGWSGTAYDCSGREEYYGNSAGLGYVVRAPEPSRSYDKWDEQEYGSDRRR